MGTLTINDCGTAHEGKLLEIYKDVVSMEKLKNGKEPSALEKSKIEMQVAEAYQIILNNCKDGGSISQALTLLSKKITTTQVNINEISKLTVSIVGEVYNKNVSNEQNEIITNIVGVMGAAQIMNDTFAENDKPEPIEIPNLWDDFKTPEIAKEFEETSKRAESGDKEAILTKGLINYSMKYLRSVDKVEPTGKQTMVLTLIQNLSSTGDKAALGIAKQLSDKYEFDVFANDEKGELTLNQEKLFGMYQDQMMQINPKAANKIVNLTEEKKDYLIALGEKTPQKYDGLLETLDNNKRKVEFTKKYGRYIKNGEFDKANELVAQNSDLAKEYLKENVEAFGEAQLKGNKKYMEHLQKTNSYLADSVAEISQKGKALDVNNVDIAEVVARVNPNPKRLIADEEMEL